MARDRETQQTDYPRTRPDLPNHEPRGCPRGASYSRYLYSANRLKYPLMRKRLLAVARGESAAQRSGRGLGLYRRRCGKAKSYKVARGRGGFVRSSWQEVNELIAAANVYTAKTFGPDRIIGFADPGDVDGVLRRRRPLPVADRRCLPELLRLVLRSAAGLADDPGEQTDVPESADWYNSSYIIALGSNVPQTRTPDAHFFTEVRYKGTKTVAVTPDYAEVAKLCDHWLNPKQGTDSAMALAMGHVMLKEFHLDREVGYFRDYVRRYTDMPMLVLLEVREGGHYAAGRLPRAADLVDGLGQKTTPSGKPSLSTAAAAICGAAGIHRLPLGREGQVELEQREGKSQQEVELQLSLLGMHDDVAEVGFPYFGGADSEHFNSVALDEILLHKLPVKRLQLADGSEALVTSVYDLQLANYGLERGLGDANCAADYDEVKAYSPARRADHRRVASQHHSHCPRVRGKRREDPRPFDDHRRRRRQPLVPHGHDLPRPDQYADLLRLRRPERRRLGALRRPEKLRPQTGWLPLAFGLDWQRPPRHMNSTSFFYNHSSQWRYETVGTDELLSPLADKSRFGGSLIDFNVRAERMGWLPSAPQLAPTRCARRSRPARRSVAGRVHRRQPEERHAGLRRRAAGQSAELPAQPVRLALQPAGLLRQGP